MIEANKNELFPITVSLLDELTGRLVSGGVVTYDIRTIDDALLAPPVSGTLSESSVEVGIYKTEVSIESFGTFICYASCDGYMAGTENIVISDRSLVAVSICSPVMDSNEFGTMSLYAKNVGLPTPMATELEVPGVKFIGTIQPDIKIIKPFPESKNL